MTTRPANATIPRRHLGLQLLRVTGLWAVGLTWVVALGCSPPEAKAPATLTIQEARERGKRSEDPDLLATWMLSELLSPEGDPAQVIKARKRLDAKALDGLWPAFARALDDSAHGRLNTAPVHFLEAARFARMSAEPEAALLGWYSVKQAIALKSNATHLFEDWKPWLETAINAPGDLGWRARSELVEWLVRESYAAAERDVDKLAIEQLGCLDHVRMAGPFGNGVAADQVLRFEPDREQHWPLVWEADPIAGHQPKQLEVEQEGCLVKAAENPERGVFYAQVDVVLDQPRDVILAVNNALSVTVNGGEVLTRSVTEWGSWTKFGVALSFPAGVHRIQAKLVSASTSVRMVGLDGTPFEIETLATPARLPSLLVPTSAGEANVLRQYVGPRGVDAPRSSALRYVAAALSNWDHEPEAAALLIEPLVKEPERSAGLSLALAADIVARDPIFNKEQTEDLVRELHAQALRRDPGLWQSELNRVGSLVKSKGLVGVVAELKQLVQRYPAAPAFLESLARVYGELGWKPEYRQTVLLRAERFPDDVDGLFAAAQAHEEAGQTELVDQLYQRVRQLDPDTEVFVGRAIERQDYAAAIDELQRLQRRRPQRRELAERIEELHRRSGGKYDVFALLRSAVEQDPTSGRARLALADAKYAAGDTKSLESALVEAVRDGAATGPLKQALDLVEGMTELERFRLDTQQVINDYEASGLQMPGTAARILDYMTVWVRSDGSSRMLEHEIVRIQSAEAIAQFAEQNLGDGVVLKARVLKQDGRILEPELVAGKPTVTFPHVEIGDYIETERLFGTFTHAEGTAYDGPQWFFREQNVAYARSEFIFIAPKDRAVEFTRRGGAPEPRVYDEGYFRVYHFRVDESPAAPNEPFSVPANEYLPNVHVGWGVDLERRLLVLNKRAFQTTPTDPRLVRIASRIVEPVGSQGELQRAQALYHWVMDNVQEGDEEDGRRVVVGKRGNRWRAFVELCRANSIPTRWVIAKNALFPDAQGPVEEAVQFSENLLRVGSGPYAWVQMNERFLPFGYVPAPVRGMPAYVLTEQGPERVTVPQGPIDDRLTYRGEFELAMDGSATVKLTQLFGGRYGAALRQGLSEVGEGRTRDVVESQLLARSLQGAILQTYAIEALDETDVPLGVNVTAEISRFARKQGKVLRVSPPFAPRLSQFATLATRQTPLLMRADQDWRVDVRVRLPAQAKVEGLYPQVVEFQGFRVTLRDRLEGGVLVLDRAIQIPAGRISPQDYARFVRFTREADTALNRELRIAVP